MRKFTYSTFIFFLFLKVFTQNTYSELTASASSAKLQKTLSIKEGDNRGKILKAFLQKYNSPLVDNADDFVKNADAYNLNWKLVAAIAGVESTFGKFIPYNSYNGWGWGVYGNNVIYFSSWKDGIKTISKGLRENYIDRGAENIYQIGRIYAQSPTWASRVEYFMQKMTEFEMQNLVSNLPISL